MIYGDEFVDEMLCKIALEVNLSEVPSPQKRQLAKPLSYYEKKYLDRDTAIINAYASGGYSMKEVGDYFKLHSSRVSRIVKARLDPKVCSLVGTNILGCLCVTSIVSVSTIYVAASITR